jgi:hypothetical protein
MTRTFRLLIITIALCLAAVPSYASAQSNPEETQGVLVGRITFVEGQLLRYVAEEKDWVATVKDAPFGMEDALFAGDDVRSEFILPNKTWIRIGGDTQIQMIALGDDLTEIDIASGIARFYNRSSKAVVKATTPFGYVTARPGSSFDLYVGDGSVEVIALKGQVDFVHETDNSSYQVVPGSSSLIADSRQTSAGEGNVHADWDDWNLGSSSLIADSRQTSAGEGNVHADWDDWNLDRDSLWSKRVQVRGDSVRYLPEPLEDEAYALEENGRWERVYYDGGYHTFWRPVRVDAGWQPFTAGRWSVWYDDNCWIPDEPFGYVTHHYGNWVYVGNYWYWAPPVVTVGAGVGPFPGIGFGWYPGRVAWLYSGLNVGWVPLGRREPYYCHRYWGPGVFVAANFTSIDINVGRFAYINHAVIINSSNFYGVNNYRTVRITNINRNTIINNYRGAPVVNNTVIGNYNNIRQRYNVSNARVPQKPHDSVVTRIERNRRTAIQNAGNLNGRAVRQSLSNAPKGTLGQAGAVQAPKVSDRMVPASRGGRIGSEVNAGRQELKRNARPQRQAAHVQPATGERGSARQGQRSQHGRKGQAPANQGQQQSDREIRQPESARPPSQMGQQPGRTSGEQSRKQRETQPSGQVRQDRRGEPSREELMQSKPGQQGRQMGRDRGSRQPRDQILHRQGPSPGPQKDRRMNMPQGRQPVPYGPQSGQQGFHEPR